MTESNLELVHVTPDQRDLDNTITVSEAALQSGFSKLTVINRVKACDLTPVARLVYGRGRPYSLYDRAAVEELLLQGAPRPRRAKQVADTVQTLTE